MDHRWVRALHDLYLVTLVIALVMTVASVADPALPVVVAVVAVVVLGAVDLLVRGRPGADAPHLVAAALVVGALAAGLPSFSVVAFGALPLAFAVTAWPVAALTGALLTGLPFVLQPWVVRQVQFGPVYTVAVTVALPVLTGLLSASAIRAVHQTRAELAAAARAAGHDEERRRLAHELHDTLAQGLSGVILQLEAADQHLQLDGSREGLARLLATAGATARACLADTRRTVEALRPEPLDDGDLATALDQVCRQWTERIGVPVTLTVSGARRRCPPEVEVVGLRVAQEALANARKHSGATRIRLAIGFRAGVVELAVADDGTGFDPARPPAPAGPLSGGAGLATMRERVEAVDGTLNIHSGPSGTRVTAVLPG